MDEEDLTDIFCILHPASHPAYKAMTLIHETTAQHTITADRNDKVIQKAEGPYLAEGQDTDTPDPEAQALFSCDIALRLSANLKSDIGGFHFGRNRARCDIVIGHDDEIKRVSNVHFRIYINEYGVVMLEDQSTNGTVVDDILLRAKDKENGRSQHSLDNASIITLTMTPPEKPFRFIVRIPQRDDEAEAVFQRNLANYFVRLNRIQEEKRARVLQARGPVPEPAREDPVSNIPQNYACLLKSCSLTFLQLLMSRPRTSPWDQSDTSRNGKAVRSIIKLQQLARAPLLLST
jgi:hypothetical protein